jgi:anti-anti-sigma regulatory factor
MEIVSIDCQAAVPVTVVELHGALDASNYLQVIDQVKSLYARGVKNLVFDLSDLNFMSSSGIVAMHSTALIMKGLQPPDPEDGWNALHSTTDVLGDGYLPNFKVVNPQPRVIRTLEVTGFNSWLEIFPDQQAALASFNTPAKN